MDLFDLLIIFLYFFQILLFLLIVFTVLQITVIQINISIKIIIKPIEPILIDLLVHINHLKPQFLLLIEHLHDLILRSLNITTTPSNYILNTTSILKLLFQHIVLLFQIIHYHLIITNMIIHYNGLLLESFHFYLFTQLGICKCIVTVFIILVLSIDTGNHIGFTVAF